MSQSDTILVATKIVCMDCVWRLKILATNSDRTSVHFYSAPALGLSGMCSSKPYRKNSRKSGMNGLSRATPVLVDVYDHKPLLRRFYHGMPARLVLNFYHDFHHVFRHGDKKLFLKESPVFVGKIIQNSVLPRAGLVAVFRNHIKSSPEALSRMQTHGLRGAVISDRYKVNGRIGAGSFGEIYNCTDLADSTEYAAKFEKVGHGSAQLRHEFKVYRELKGSTGICTAQYFGDHLKFRVLVIQLMGPSIEDVFEKCHMKFSLKTVLQLADQLVQRITALHSRSIIHRDIKPQNFVLGLKEECNTVYCLDFGLAKLYRDRRTLRHLPKRDGSLAGTPRYASINNHLGIAQSRRDDFESVAYMLIYFLKGRLPWQGLKATYRGTKYRLIQQSKQSTLITDLCAGLPEEFAIFLKYTRTLKFEEDPNISYIRNLFRDLYEKNNFHLDQGPMWDWDVLSSNTLPPPPTQEKKIPPLCPDPEVLITTDREALAAGRTDREGEGNFVPTNGGDADKHGQEGEQGDDDSLAPNVGKD